MSKPRVDQKTGRAYTELDPKFCPLSGISCADCGYPDMSDEYNCFLAEFLDIFRSLNAE